MKMRFIVTVFIVSLFGGFVFCNFYSAQAQTSNLVVKTRTGTDLSDPVEEVYAFPAQTITFVAQGSSSGAYFWNVVGESTYEAEADGFELVYTAGDEDRVKDYVTVNDGMENEVTVIVHIAKILATDDNTDVRGGNGPGCFISILK